MSINVKTLGFTPTKNEIAIAREVWAKTPNVNVKTLLSPFSNECPICKAGEADWKLIPPIRPSGKIHFVRYQCQKCQATFTKAEESGD